MSERGQAPGRKGPRAWAARRTPPVWLPVVVMGLLGLLLAAKAAPELRRVMRQTPWDLNVDHLTARAYLENYSPYTPAGAQRSGVAVAGPSGHGHPPTTSFWALPLAPLNIRTAGAVLAWLTFVLLFVQLFVAMRILAFPAPAATAWLATAYVAGCSFMSYHVGVGQISGLIGFFYFVGWWAARSGKDVAAGAALGAACTLKLFPGVMILFLLMSRRFRAVLAAVAVYLAIAAVMTARFGLGSWRRFFSVQPMIADQWMGNIQNQSLHGIVTRLFEPVCTRHGPVLPTAMRISAVASVLVLALAAWWCRRLWRSPAGAPAGSPAGFDATFALFAAISVLTSQWVWEHYAIIHVLPLVVLAAQLRSAWRAGRPRWQVAALAAALLGIVASWQVDIHLKQHLQRAVLAGDRGPHLRLHLVDILNWAPGVVLVVALFVVCKWRHDQATSGRAAPGPEVGGAHQQAEAAVTL